MELQTESNKYTDMEGIYGQLWRLRELVGQDIIKHTAKRRTGPMCKPVEERKREMMAA